MEFYGVKIPIIKKGDDYVKAIVNSIQASDHSIEDDDIIVIASKVVSSALGIMADMSKIRVGAKAKAIAKKYGLNPPHIQLILDQAEEVYGGVVYENPHFVVFWTRKGGAFEINSGVDIKNSPPGSETIDLPDGNKVARQIRVRVKELTGKRVGISIIDSNWYPLRNGSTGFTVGMAGFEPVKNCTIDENGRPALDIYERPVPLARHNVADDVASGAHLLIGEAGERVGAVIAKHVPAGFTDTPDYGSLLMKPNECTVMLTFKPTRKIVTRHRWRDSEAVLKPAAK